MITEKTDAELVALTKAGDNDAFSVLMKRYQTTATAVAFRFVGNQQIAQELVQEAMLQAYLSLNHLQDSARFKGWLCGIVANESRAYLRNLKPLTFSLDVLMSTPSHDGLSVSYLNLDPQDMVEAHETQQQVEAALSQLSSRNRQATLLFYYHHLSLQEIATSLGISLVAVKSRLHKGRHELRELLAAVGMERGMKGWVSHKKGKETAMINLTIVKVLVYQQASCSLILLLDEAGQRVLPIWLNGRDGSEIQAGFSKGTRSAVFTFELVADVVKTIAGKRVEVRLEQIAEMMYGVVMIHKGKKTHEFKARVSDVLALAAHTDCPISASREVMEAALPIPLLPDDSGLSREQKLARVADELERQAVRKVRGKRPEKPSNLSFEDGLAGWTPAATNQGQYAWEIDPAAVHNGGSSLCLMSKGEGPQDRGQVVQYFHSGRYRGRRLRFSASLKTEEVVGWAGLLMGVEGLQGPLMYDDMKMSERALVGTQDWQQYSTVLDVAEQSVQIVVGIVLSGKGRVWMSQCEVEEVGQDVATTPMNYANGKHPLNLNFAQGKEGWSKYGTLPLEYDFEIDPGVSQSGTASATLKFTGTDPSGFGTCSQFCLADDYRGKKIRLSGLVKTEGVESWAGLLMWVCSKVGIIQSFDNMEDRAIRGTQDWTPCEITLPVFADSQYICLGLLLDGNGQVWLDDVQFESVEEVEREGHHQ